jgi:hypothetical protein
LSKIFGKSILVGLWCALVLANLICLVKMRESDFRDWAILSVSEFFIIMIVADPILYLILASIMIKKEQNRDIKRRSDTNDDIITYYTSEIHENNRCAKLFVTIFIGKEKMKDLRRKLNPFNPI